MSETDVCLILEGTYPYVTGGVSTWTHDLIKNHKDLSFQLISLLPPNFQEKLKYQLPDNVVGLQNIYIQQLPSGVSYLPEKKLAKFFEKLEKPLLRLQYKGDIKDVEEIMYLFEEMGVPLGEGVLMLSDEAWRMLVRMYSASCGTSSFLDFFWSWRGLFGGLFSILLCPLPDAKVYHALCTGYAGMLLSRAHLEKQKPCMITEHGIYTNERRIEIASAHWIEEALSFNLNIERQRMERGLKDLWIDTFTSYSKICYQSSDKIITLHEGNQPLQISDGADPEKMMIIANGIDVDHYEQIQRDTNHDPTVALIGRVVPIKDIKTFIRAVSMLKATIPNIKAYILGPTEEDPTYFEECLELVQSLKLGSTLTFPGKVQVDEWLPKIDLMVLTSISESQPLTLLEAGACGIPSVATNVGSCNEIINGRKNEDPPLGEGGLVSPLANPKETARLMEKLLLDKEFYASCSSVIKERVRAYYHEDIQREAYDELYKQYMLAEV